MTFSGLIVKSDKCHSFIKSLSRRRSWKQTDQKPAWSPTWLFHRTVPAQLDVARRGSARLDTAGHYSDDMT